MPATERYRSKVAGGGSYFASPKTGINFIKSGSTLLDLALGGGWAEGRIANIVGDKSTGKTLLCIEAAANFCLAHPKGKIRYREAEAAFDKPYAGALGMPLDRVDFGTPLDTVEDFFEDLDKVCKAAKQPELYILDSLDALSDREEMGRDMDEGTYGTGKAKKLSQLFRRLVRNLETSKVTLVIVSQIRSKIGVSFGRHTTRSGGRSLDFYASQVVYLSQAGTLSRTVHGIKRTTGIQILAKVDKNKVGLPFREAAFDIRFGYGVDDVTACLEWLADIKHEERLAKDNITKFVKDIGKLEDSEYYAEVDRIHKLVETAWYDIEKAFLPTRRKYSQ